MDNFLDIYNLKGTVHFPTRITTTTVSTIDNIFIDKNINYSINTYINGLSDHNAQILILNDLTQSKKSSKFILTRNFNTNSIADFLLSLSYEQWSEILMVNDVNLMFNNFLNVYLRCYSSSFPRKKKYIHNYPHNCSILSPIWQFRPFHL